MSLFEKIREQYPDWEAAFPNEWAKPTRKELDRIQKTYGVTFPQEFVEFQLTECLITPMGDFVWDGFGFASTDIDPCNSLSEIVSDAQAFGVPKNLAPFRDSNSDFFCFTQSGEVVVWDHNSNDLYQQATDRWPSFGAWLAASFEEDDV